MKTPKRAVADAAADATAKPAPSEGTTPSQDDIASTAETSPITPAEGGEKTGDGTSEAGEPVSGLTPTKAPVRNAYGLELDRFGLPVNGPARAAVLAKMGVADPALEPGEWDFRDGDRAAELMEKIYG